MKTYAVGDYTGDWAALVLAFGLLLIALFLAFSAERMRLEAYRVSMEECPHPRGEAWVLDNDTELWYYGREYNYTEDQQRILS